MLLVGDAAAFVDPLFSTGVLLAVNGAKLACRSTSTRRSRDDDFCAERFIAYQDQLRGRHGHVQAPGARVLLGEPAQACSSTSARNPDRCARSITSMLAGDVYKPSMWHSVVRERGFSHKTLTPRQEVACARSSRDVRED